MKEKTSLILSEAGSVKVLNENKKEVFITPEHLKIGKLKLSEILAKQQETNNFVDIKLKTAERDFLQILIIILVLHITTTKVSD